MTAWHSRDAVVPACGRPDSHSWGATRTRIVIRCEGERHNVPSPLAGEGQGEGWRQTLNLGIPPSLSLPRKGGGNARADQQSLVAAVVTPTGRRSLSQ